MKKLFTLIALGAALSFASGCYTTQEGRHQFGTPWGKDTIESRYERPVDKVFDAARETLGFNGTLTSENRIANTLTAQIDKRTVWIAVDEVQPGVSRIKVQARKIGRAHV